MRLRTRYTVTATLFVLLLGNCAVQAKETCVLLERGGMTDRDICRVEENAGVEYAYVCPEVADCVKKASDKECRECSEVCELCNQLCQGYKTAKYDLVRSAVDTMLRECCDEDVCACLEQYCGKLEDKTVCIKKAYAPSRARRAHIDCPDCAPVQDCSGLVEPVFTGIVCNEGGFIPPIPPIPAEQGPFVPDTPQCNIIPPTGALQLCSIDVNGTVTAEEIAAFELCVEEDVDVLGDLLVGGSGNFGGNVVSAGTGSFDQDLIVGGDFDLLGSLFSDGNLNVLGSGFIGDDLNVGGDLMIGGMLSFSGAMVGENVDITIDALCANEVLANTGCFNNVEMCQLVLENLFIKGFVKAEKGAAAFCDIAGPDKQGFGEIVFTACDIVNYTCLDRRVTGCGITLAPSKNALRYNFDCGGICAGDVEDLIFGVKLFNRDDNTPAGLTLPHVDFAVPADLDIECNVIEVDLHLIVGSGTTNHVINLILASNFVSGNCEQAEQLPKRVYTLDLPCELPEVNNPVCPYHLRASFRIELSDLQEQVMDTLELRDWIRLSFAVNPLAGQLGLLPDDCVLINSVVVRYPRVDATEAMLPCIPCPV